MSPEIIHNTVQCKNCRWSSPQGCVEQNLIHSGKTIQSGYKRGDGGLYKTDKIWGIYFLYKKQSMIYKLS